MLRGRAYVCSLRKLLFLFFLSGGDAAFSPPDPNRSKGRGATSVILTFSSPLTFRLMGESAVSLSRTAYYYVNLCCWVPCAVMISFDRQFSERSFPAARVPDFSSDGLEAPGARLHKRQPVPALSDSIFYPPLRPFPSAGNTLSARLWPVGAASVPISLPRVLS